jgi:ABC-type multidrug transport system fused ATPase/permease subunit
MPSILLLDEATSALDEESQRKVQNALGKCMVGRTSIVVAHRLTTVEKCNRIAVIADGKVAEEGTFDQLTKADGGYFANLATGMRKQEQKETKGRARSISRTLEKSISKK